MLRIGILGDIGAGKSYVAKNFGYPIFDADQEVSKLYKSDKKIFNKYDSDLTLHDESDFSGKNQNIFKEN